MELADCTLRNRLEACREAGRAGIPEGELINYLREAAEGLDFLHAKHVVHRDVKPDNILLLNGHAKVADFGLAWQQDKTMAPMKTFAGTPAYMAPEIWGKEGGPPSDLYALAVTYVELRQGRPPLASQPIHEMMFAHLDGVHDFEPFVREDERVVIEKALARVPEERYGSCSEFVESLAVALGVSVVPRSGVIPAPGSRLVASPSSGNWKQSTKPTPASGNVGASVGTSTVAERTHAGAGSGTVVDPPRPPGIGSPPHPRGKRPFAAIIAAVLTVALVSVLGFAIRALFWNDSKDRAGGTGDGDTNNGGATDPKPTPKTTPKTNGNGNKKVGPDPVVLPLNTFQDPKAKIVNLADGRQVYDLIVAKSADKDVRFRLITPSGGPRQIAPFYIMESKVWNGLYRDVQAISPESEKNGPDAPVTGITAEEAATFAWAAFGKNFRLPSPDEWDHAAGLYKNLGRDEVTRRGGQPRVRSRSPN